MLDVAVGDQRIGINPAKGTKLPRARRAEPRFLSAGEVTALTLAAGRGGPIIAVLAWCGLRFGELAALRVRDLDLERARLSVEQSVTDVGGRLVCVPTLSRTTVAPFHSHARLADCFATRQLGRASMILCSRHPAGECCVLATGGVVFDPARKRIGREDITPHDLRHTAASLAIRAGANVKAVQTHARSCVRCDDPRRVRGTVP